MDKSILFYDSGIGGLSTLAKTIQILPNEKYIYFADNLHVPYGNRTNQEICDLVYANILALLKRFKVKLIVIACNTATSLAIDFLRSKIQRKEKQNQRDFGDCNKSHNLFKTLFFAFKISFMQSSLLLFAISCKQN